MRGETPEALADRARRVAENDARQQAIAEAARMERATRSVRRVPKRKTALAQAAALKDRAD